MQDNTKVNLKDFITTFSSTAASYNEGRKKSDLYASDMLKTLEGWYGKEISFPRIGILGNSTQNDNHILTSETGLEAIALYFTAKLFNDIKNDTYDDKKKAFYRSLFANLAVALTDQKNDWVGSVNGINDLLKDGPSFGTWDWGLGGWLTTNKETLFKHVWGLYQNCSIELGTGKDGYTTNNNKAQGVLASISSLIVRELGQAQKTTVASSNKIPQNRGNISDFGYSDGQPKPVSAQEYEEIGGSRDKTNIAQAHVMKILDPQSPDQNYQSTRKHADNKKIVFQETIGGRDGMNNQGTERKKNNFGTPEKHQYPKGTQVPANNVSSVTPKKNNLQDSHDLSFDSPDSQPKQYVGDFDTIHKRGGFINGEMNNNKATIVENPYGGGAIYNQDNKRTFIWKDDSLLESAKTLDEARLVIERLHKQITELKADMQKLTNPQTTEQNFSRIENKVAIDTEALQKTINDLKKQIEVLKQENTGLKSNKQDVTNFTQYIDDNEKTINDLKKQIVLLEQENTGLKDNVSHSQQDNNEVRKKIRELEGKYNKESNQYNTTIRQLKLQVTTLQGQLAGAQQNKKINEAEIIAYLLDHEKATGSNKITENLEGVMRRIIGYLPSPHPQLKGTPESEVMVNPSPKPINNNPNDNRRLTDENDRLKQENDRLNSQIINLRLQLENSRQKSPERGGRPSIFTQQNERFDSRERITVMNGRDADILAKQTEMEKFKLLVQPKLETLRTQLEAFLHVVQNNNLLRDLTYLYNQITTLGFFTNVGDVYQVSRDFIPTPQQISELYNLIHANLEDRKAEYKSSYKNWSDDVKRRHNGVIENQNNLCDVLIGLLPNTTEVTSIRRMYSVMEEQREKDAASLNNREFSQQAGLLNSLQYFIDYLGGRAIAEDRNVLQRAFVDVQEFFGSRVQGSNSELVNNFKTGLHDNGGFCDETGNLKRFDEEGVAELGNLNQLSLYITSLLNEVNLPANFPRDEFAKQGLQKILEAITNLQYRHQPALLIRKLEELRRVVNTKDIDINTKQAEIDRQADAIRGFEAEILRLNDANRRALGNVEDLSKKRKDLNDALSRLLNVIETTSKAQNLIRVPNPTTAVIDQLRSKDRTIDIAVNNTGVITNVACENYSDNTLELLHEYFTGLKEGRDRPANFPVGHLAEIDIVLRAIDALRPQRLVDELARVNRELDTAKASIITKDRTISDFETRVRTFTLEKERLTDAVHNYEVQVAGLNVTIREREATIEERNVSITDLKREILELRRQLADVNNNIAMAGVVQVQPAPLQAPQARHVGAGVAVADPVALQAKIDRLTIELNTVTVERDAARRELNTVTAERDAANLRITALTTELDAARRERDAFRGELETARRERDAFRGELETANINITRLRGERDAFRGEFETAKRDLDAAKRDLDAAMRRATDTRDVTRLRDEVTRLTNVQNDYNNLTTIHNTLRDKVKVEMDNLKAAKDAAEAALRDSNSKLGEANVKIRRLETESVDYRKSIVELETTTKQLLAEIEALKKSLQTATIDAKNASESAKDAGIRLRKAEEALEKTQVQLNDTKAKLSETSSAKNAAESAKNAAETEAKKLYDELLKLKSTFDKFKSEADIRFNSEIERGKKELNSKLEEAQKEYRNQAEQTAALKAKLIDMTRELESARKTQAELSDRIRQLDSQISELNKVELARQQTIGNYEKKIAIYEETRVRLQEQIELAKKNPEEAAKVKELEKQVAEMSKQMAVLQDEKNKTIEYIKALQAELVASKNEMDQLKVRLANTYKPEDVKKLEDLVQALNIKSNEATKRQADLEVLLGQEKQKTDDASRVIKELQEEIIKLQTEKDTLTLTVKKYRANIDELYSQMRDLKNTIKELQDKPEVDNSEEIKKYQMQLIALKAISEDYVKQITELNDNQVVLDKKMLLLQQDLKNENQKKQDLQNNLTGKQKDIQQLEDIVVQLGNEVDHLKKRPSNIPVITALNNEIERLKEELDRLSKENAKPIVVNKATETEVIPTIVQKPVVTDTIPEAFAAFKTRLLSLPLIGTDVFHKYNKLVKNLQKIQSQTNFDDKILTSTDEQLKAIEDKYKTYPMKIRPFRTKINAGLEYIKDQSGTLTDVTTRTPKDNDLEVLRNDINSLNNQINKLNNLDLVTYRIAPQDYETAFEKTQQDIQDLQSKVDFYDKRIVGLEQECSNMEKKAQGYKTDITQLPDDLIKLNNAILDAALKNSPQKPTKLQNVPTLNMDQLNSSGDYSREGLSARSSGQAYQGYHMKKPKYQPQPTKEIQVGAN